MLKHPQLSARASQLSEADLHSLHLIGQLLCILCSDWLKLCCVRGRKLISQRNSCSPLFTKGKKNPSDGEMQEHTKYTFTRNRLTNSNKIIYKVYKNDFYNNEQKKYYNTIFNLVKFRTIFTIYIFYIYIHNYSQRGIMHVKKKKKLMFSGEKNCAHYAEILFLPLTNFMFPWVINSLGHPSPTQKRQMVLEV